MKKRLIVVLLTALLLSSMAVISFASYDEISINKTNVATWELNYNATTGLFSRDLTGNFSPFTQSALYEFQIVLTDTSMTGQFMVTYANTEVNTQEYTTRVNSVIFYQEASSSGIILTMQFDPDQVYTSGDKAYCYIYRINSVGATEAYENGKADGLTEGYDNGYEVGYDNGKTDGLTEGFDNGYEVGESDGYANGRTDGYRDGYNQGIQDGTGDYNSGYQVGYQHGLAEGQSVNEVIGNAMNGFFDGVSVFLEPFMSLGIGVLTIRNLMFLLCATAIGVFIVKIVRG